jgi:hypothetical protein
MVLNPNGCRRYIGQLSLAKHRPVDGITTAALIKERSAFITERGIALNPQAIPLKHTKRVLGSSIKSLRMSTLDMDLVDGDATLMAATDTICK